MTSKAGDSPASPRARWFERHPRLALLAFNAALLAVLAVVAEIGLRLYIPYNPGFYTGVSATSREVVYPYGVIKINSEGFPDEEFDLSRPHKIGYVGDSVTYGVGAGYGYRITELLEQAYPQYEHMNLGGIGLSISDGEIHRFTDLAMRYGLEKLVYLLNLNDILPTAEASGKEPTRLARITDFVSTNLDWLRGRSFLYTALRTQAKNALESLGYGFHGYEAYELYPERYAQVIGETAERVNEFHRSLADHGIELIVVVLPYEMQISGEAAQVYASKGVHWEPDFIAGRTQQLLLQTFDPDLKVFDAYHAFVDDRDPEGSRARNRLGEYFVYDKGDKLDWNHPNRAGHRAIATYLAAHEVFGAPDAKLAADARPGG